MSINYFRLRLKFLHNILILQYIIAFSLIDIYHYLAQITLMILLRIFLIIHNYLSLHIFAGFIYILTWLLF